MERVLPLLFLPSQSVMELVLPCFQVDSLARTMNELRLSSLFGLKVRSLVNDQVSTSKGLPRSKKVLSSLGKAVPLERKRRRRGRISDAFESKKEGRENSLHRDHLLGGLIEQLSLAASSVKIVLLLESRRKISGSRIKPTRSS